MIKMFWQVAVPGHVFMFDVLQMGRAFFDEGMKDILENEHILKVIYYITNFIQTFWKVPVRRTWPVKLCSDPEKFHLSRSDCPVTILRFYINNLQDNIKINTVIISIMYSKSIIFINKFAITK
jgi:hypothetical protein